MTCIGPAGKLWCAFQKLSIEGCATSLIQDLGRVLGGENNNFDWAVRTLSHAQHLHIIHQDGKMCEG